jgi:hypothetical protein
MCSFVKIDALAAKGLLHAEQQASICFASRSEQPINILDYKGYRIEVTAVGKGWRAAIFTRESTRALADSPFNLEQSRAEEVVAEAKRIIDARLGPRSL